MCNFKYRNLDEMDLPSNLIPIKGAIEFISDGIRTGWMPKKYFFNSALLLSLNLGYAAATSVAGYYLFNGIENLINK